MIKNRNFLCLSTTTWDGNFAKTIVELMSIFGRQNKVLYIDYQFTVKDVLFSLFGKNEIPVSRILGLKPRLRHVKFSEGEVYVLTPPMIITNNFLPHGQLYNFIQKINSRIIGKSIKIALRKLKMQDDLIYINSFNSQFGLPLMNYFNEKISIYHCYDEVSAAGWMIRHGTPMEKEFMPKVDAVITTSLGLLLAKKSYNPNTFLVRNGVNYKLFSEGFRLEPPAGKPVVGYIGSIDFRTDVDMLEEVIRLLPQFDFSFTGRVSDHSILNKLKKYTNVAFHDPVQVDSLPKILSTFSVGIIPFAKNEFNKGVYPLKINEYLAAGLPVVMTRFGKLDEFNHTVSFADDAPAFSAAINEAIQQDSPDKRKKRAEIAASNSWDARVKEISDIIINLESLVKN